MKSQTRLSQNYISSMCNQEILKIANLDGKDSNLRFIETDRAEKVYQTQKSQEGKKRNKDNCYRWFVKNGVETEAESK